jgi:alkylhydroperoxidase/carboxymuconolactone decarboxylase family protein YurZ
MHRLLQDVAEGPLLDDASGHLVAFAVRISVSTLDPSSAAMHARAALSAGLSPAQLREAIFLVSGLGVHSLFEGLQLTELALEVQAAPAPLHLDPQRQALWDRWVGTDRYWLGFEQEVPGFLSQLLAASPEGFDAFFRYCSVPWQSAQLSALSKELIAMATDATPTHRYLPGFRLHLRNALKLGAGAAMVRSVLDIASQAPLHPGIPGRSIVAGASAEPNSNQAHPSQELKHP